MVSCGIGTFPPDATAEGAREMFFFWFWRGGGRGWRQLRRLGRTRPSVPKVPARTAACKHLAALKREERLFLA